MRVRITSVYSQTKLMELWALRAEARDPEDRERTVKISKSHIFSGGQCLSRP